MPVIILRIVHNVYNIRYAITSRIYFDISFNFEMKRKKTIKKLYYFKKKKGKKVQFASTGNQTQAN